MEKWIVLGAVTRNRPRMFAELLKSFEELKMPADTKVTFCFCENSDGISVGPYIDKFVQRTGYKAITLLQPRLGIPFARNTVLNWAAEAGADYLTFVDDDETVDRFWLLELLKEHRQSGADLTGGPVFPVSQDSEIGFWQDLNLESIQKREKRKSRKETKNVQTGASDKVVVATNNWMFTLDCARRHGLRFDETIGQSSGSDSVFCNDLKKLGGKVSWANKAAVYEAVPSSRLTTAYTFCRARDGTLATFRTLDKAQFGIGVANFFSRVAYIFSKSLVALLRLLVAPFNKGRSVPPAIRSLGCAWGALLSLVGKDASRYRTTDGN